MTTAALNRARSARQRFKLSRRHLLPRLSQLPASLLLVAALLPVAGCAIGTAAGPALNPAPDRLGGTVFGGQQPIAGATIAIYEVGSTAYGVASTTPKATTTSDANGNFLFGTDAAGTYTCTAANTPMYLVATGGSSNGYSVNVSLAMLALIPTCAAGKTSTFTLNEVVTAASILAAAPFLGTSLGTGVVPQIGGTCTSCAAGVYNQGLVNAFSNTFPALVDSASGIALSSATASGVTVTRETAKLNTIANVLAACINSDGATGSTETVSTCGQLFTAVNAIAALPRPADTVQAALMMALYPSYNTTAVFNLAAPASPFTGLGSAPADWTVALAYTTTALGLGISQSTAASMDIDLSGNIWIPSNKTGAAGIAKFAPATGTFNLSSAGTTYPQYLAIDLSVFGSNITFTDSRVNNSPMSGNNIYFYNTAQTSMGGHAITTGISSESAVLVTSGNNYNLGTVFAYWGLLHNGVPDTGTFNEGSNGAAFLANLPWSYLPNGLTLYNESSKSVLVASEPSPTGCLLETSTSGSPSGTTATLVSSPGTNCVPSNIAKLYAAGATEDNFMVTSYNQLCDTLALTCVSVQGDRALQFDGAGTLWITASTGSIHPYTVTSSAASLTATAIGSGYAHPALMPSPVASAIDASGNLWSVNADCFATTSTPCSANSLTLTEIVGVAHPTVTPLAGQYVALNALPTH
jgi:hypothetical protein